MSVFAWRRCRFCQLTGTGLVHYTVRGYAHSYCLLLKKGPGIVDKMPLGSLGQLVVSDLRRHGVLDKVMKRLDASQKAMGL